MGQDRLEGTDWEGHVAAGVGQAATGGLGMPQLLSARSLLTSFGVSGVPRSLLTGLGVSGVQVWGGGQSLPLFMAPRRSEAPWRGLMKAWERWVRSTDV